MTLWETQELEEAAAAAQWESLNEPDPGAGQFAKAADSLKNGIELMDKAGDWVYQAADDINDRPMAYRLEAMTEEIDRILSELKQIKETIEEEARE